MTEIWNRFPGGVMEFSSQETLRSHLDTVLCSWLWVVMRVGPPEVPSSLYLRNSEKCIQSDGLVFPWGKF